MATFDPASSRVHDLIREVIDEYHPDLVEADARIGAVFAHPALDGDGEPKGPPMVKDGRQILARIKRNSEEDRAGGKDDATITIDAAEWKRLDGVIGGELRQRALLDHELYHLVVQREKPFPGQKVGGIKTDDKGRPLFKLRPHDWEITGFRVVVERHGRHSYEHAEARRFHDAYGNLLFDFADDLAVDRGEILDQAFDQVAAEINAGALGPNVTAKVTNRSRRKPEAAVVEEVNP